MALVQPSVTERAAQPCTRVGDMRRSGPKNWRLLAWAALCWAACVSTAYADLWGFVDKHGVAHIAEQKLDDRYELFFRSPQGPQSAEQAFVQAGRSEAAPPSLDAVPDGARKLTTFFEISPSYKALRPLLRQVSQSQGLDYELLKALILIESGFDAQAVSPKGAVGLMQLMPTTAQHYGVQSSRHASVTQLLKDPATNLRTGGQHLADLIKQFPERLDLVLAAYNAGAGAVQRAGNQVPNFPETQHYVKAVLHIYNALKSTSKLTAKSSNQLAAPQRIRAL